MRLWSLHPRYLDARGLVALWREGLLAQAVLLGRTRGYNHHPQLLRFRTQPSLEACIHAYLREVHAESVRRGYGFDAERIDGRAVSRRVTRSVDITRGQLAYEWDHLRRKLAVRDPRWLESIAHVTQPRAHPLFRVVPGPPAAWEKVANVRVRRRG